MNKKRNDAYNRELLTYTCTEEETAEIARSEKNAARIRTGILLVMTGAVLAIIFLMCSCSMADTVVIKQDNIAGYSLNQWANAIYIAEGGQKTRHPYGILATYKHTTARQACINTIKSKYKQWVKIGRHGAFIAFLASKYCPVGCDNDVGTNRYWVKNVSYWLERG